MFQVLREHAPFQRLWGSQVVSQAGDWLSRIAILTLISELGDPGVTARVGLLYAVELAVRFLPAALIGPLLAGSVADRLPRRRVMITADLLRAAIVASMCWVDDASDLPLLYALLTLQVCMTVFFDAAKSAALPNTVSSKDLHAAYALSAATWSTMVSVGSVLGAILLDAFGRRTVFLVDAGTYLLSAALLLGLRLPPNRAEGRFSIGSVLRFEDMRRALRYVREQNLQPVLLAKTFWGGCGGYLVMLSVVGTERFGSYTSLFSGPAAPAVTGFATGALYAARGVGTGVGPILARRVLGSDEPALLRQIAGGFFVAALAYSLFALAPNLALAALLVVLAHLGGSALWIASTTLWQRRASDEYRGRIHSLEFLGMTVGFSFGAFLAGGVYDTTLSIETTLWTVSVVVVLSGLAWRHIARRSLLER